MRAGTGGFLETQFLDRLNRLGTRQGFEGVPAPLSGGGDDGVRVGEVVNTLHRAEASRGFLVQLVHSEIALGLVEGDDAVEGSITGSGEPDRQRGGHVAVVLAGEAGGSVGAGEEPTGD